MKPITITVSVLLLLVGAVSAQEWHVEIVDPGGWVGQYSSLTLDDSGYPHISYCDHSHYDLDLKYARWDGGAWQIETVDSVGYWGVDTSLALDDSNYPHISYGGSGDLRYARWDGSTWRKETVDSVGNVGYYTSLVLDTFDHPHISYRDTTTDSLKYARWDGAAWQVETVDSEGDVGLSTSLALDDSNYPHILPFITSIPSHISVSNLDGPFLSILGIWPIILPKPRDMAIDPP